MPRIAPSAAVPKNRGHNTFIPAESVPCPAPSTPIKTYAVGRESTTDSNSPKAPAANAPNAARTFPAAVLSAATPAKNCAAAIATANTAKEIAASAFGLGSPRVAYKLVKWNTTAVPIIPHKLCTARAVQNAPVR